MMVDNKAKAYCDNYGYPCGKNSIEKIYYYFFIDGFLIHHMLSELSINVFKVV